MANYFRARSKSPLKKTYVFIDTPERYSRELFFQMELFPLKEEYFEDPESSYVYVVCEIFRWRSIKFVICMERLQKYIRKERKDYDEACSRFAEKIKGEKK